MDVETQIVKETRKLDSEMQTLVSENYNKFISATDTIRRMRSDFKTMEEEMERLVVNMEDITVFNERINHTFRDKRSELTRLSGINSLLKKLQFLFDLPAKLTELMSARSYARAVHYYCKARKLLDHYKHISTFRNIDDDCQSIIGELKRRLYDQLDTLDHNSASTQAISDAIHLLYQLDEPMDNLCAKYLSRVEKWLDHDLLMLRLNIDLLESDTKQQHQQQNQQQLAPILMSRRTATATATADESAAVNRPVQIAMDILEFIDHGCNHFLANMGSTIHSFKHIFEGEREYGHE